MNIGEYVRETMSVAAYDDLIDRLDAAVKQDPLEPEDPGSETLARVEEHLLGEVARIHRAIRAQVRDLNPHLRATVREQGRHLVYSRVHQDGGYAVIERLPIDDGTEFGCWRERPITRVFWHVPERRWRCGCHEFVWRGSCEHVAVLATLCPAGDVRVRDITVQPDDRVCGCGDSEFIGGLCAVCRHFAEQRWAAQWPTRRIEHAPGSRVREASPPVRWHRRGVAGMRVRPSHGAT